MLMTESLIFEIPTSHFIVSWRVDNYIRYTLDESPVEQTGYLSLNPLLQSLLSWLIELMLGNPHTHMHSYTEKTVF